MRLFQEDGISGTKSKAHEKTIHVFNEMNKYKAENKSLVYTGNQPTMSIGNK